MDDIKKWQEEFLEYVRGLNLPRDDYRGIVAYMDEAPTIEPKITDEQAIEHLRLTGWMQNHDREMYESGIRKQLADDSRSYDSLIPCEDTISRRAAVDAVERNACNTQRAIDAINNLPSAQPERLKGKWIEVNDFYNRISGRCFVCGWEAHMYEDDVVGMNFCPNCGADMRGEDHDATD